MTRSSAWRRTTRGFFVLAAAPDSTAQRIIDVVPLIPATGALTGWAAGFVHEVDLLDGLEVDGETRLPLTINLGRDLGRAEPAGVRFIRERMPEWHRQQLHGLSVTTPLRTAFDGARHAPDLVEAVVFLDQVLGGGLDLGLAGLEVWRTPPTRWRGIDQFRQAVELADPCSANAWESRLRMFAMLQAGFPRLEVNRPVFDLDENFIGIPDLLDVEAGLALEFDGQDHRKRRQHRADNIREEELELTNLTVCRVDSLDLGQPRSLRTRLTARRAQGMARDRRRDRWTLVEPAWWRRRRAA
jgi:hypothetical protein